MDVKEIIHKMQVTTKEDIDLVINAYTFAQEAHKEHKRYSGEPYFIHLFETAKNLADLGMDGTVIAAGLLHDTLEDVGVKEETIEKEFGAEILFLIQGVTKLGKLKYRGAKRHTESLRKFFVAMAQDIRVLIIKLTDRLHNMRTLQYVPEHKRKRIAMETLEIYAPLAYRLGMRRVHRELEDLSFPYVYPEEYKKTKKVLRERSKHLEERVTKILHALKKNLAKEGVTNFMTDYRVKGSYSLYQKLLRKNMDIEQVYDISAIRIVVPTVADCYRVLGIIHEFWRPLPGRIKDYIALPKPNGYRSLHTTVFTGDGNFVEMQIRTEEMHREAEYGIASHFIYKEVQKSGWRRPVSPNLVWLRNLLPLYSPAALQGQRDREKFQDVPQWIKHLANEQNKVRNNGFMENLRSDFFVHRVFVFTPKGDVVDLPIDSSPVDFAYAIHSEIGDHVSAAKVNGKLVTLDTPLKNGDILEIITKPSAKPSKKWLDFSKTIAAKQHIRSYLELHKTR